jgi:hypothetical protein
MSQPDLAVSGSARAGRALVALELIRVSVLERVGTQGFHMLVGEARPIAADHGRLRARSVQ